MSGLTARAATRHCASSKRHSTTSCGRARRAVAARSPPDLVCRLSEGRATRRLGKFPDLARVHFGHQHLRLGLHPSSCCTRNRASLPPRPFDDRDPRRARLHRGCRARPKRLTFTNELLRQRLADEAVPTRVAWTSYPSLISTRACVRASGISVSRRSCRRSLRAGSSTTYAPAGYAKSSSAGR